MVKSGLEKGMSVLDAFTGTAIMAQKFKSIGMQTTANDHLYFCYALADAHLFFRKVPNFENLDLGVPVFDYLNKLVGKPDFITRNYSPYEECSRMYLTVENAMKVDVIRNKIENWKRKNLITIHEFNYLIASLLYAINLVSNITGTYGAYLKFWESRSQKTLIMKKIEITDNKMNNHAYNLDASEVVKRKYDFIYLDPPYNSRSYFSNYFFLELVAKGWYETIPNPKGQTGITKNIAIASEFSSRKTVIGAFHDLLSKANTPLLALSYNNEGLVDQEKVLDILKNYGPVKIFEVEHKRYRSINQSGNKAKTKELLMIVRKK